MLPSQWLFIFIPHLGKGFDIASEGSKNINVCCNKVAPADQFEREVKQIKKNQGRANNYKDGKNTETESTRQDKEKIYFKIKTETFKHKPSSWDICHTINHLVSQIYIHAQVNSIFPGGVDWMSYMLSVYFKALVVVGTCCKELYTLKRFPKLFPGSFILSSLQKKESISGDFETPGQVWKNIPANGFCHTNVSGSVRANTITRPHPIPCESHSTLVVQIIPWSVANLSNEPHIGCR